MAGTLLVLGDVFQYLMPINKSLWSSSFVLMTGGISCLLLALFVYWVDIKGHVTRFKMARVFGTNAIFAYTLAGIFYTFFYSKKLWGFSLSATFVEQAIKNFKCLKKNYFQSLIIIALGLQRMYCQA